MNATATMANVALPPGTVLGNYKLLQPLGQGGFGITYVAWDNNLKRNVVLKENFPTGLCFRDEASGEIRVFREDDFLLYQTTIASLTKEAQTLASLNHERIVRVYDVFESHGSIFYVMPWLKGGSLRERMNQVATQENRISPEQATEWLRMLLDGLEYLHNKGIYHRDIKPGNILFDEHDRPVFIDFGAALNKPEATGTITQGEFSYAYASPEQITGKGEIGPWTDFYALAATWYELISGIQVEPADKRLMQDDVVPLVEMNLSSEWPRNLLISIDKGLRLKPSERFGRALKREKTLDKNETPPEPQAKKQTQPANSSFKKGRWVSIFLLIIAALIATFWHAEKTGYAYEYIPSLQKTWRTVPKNISTPEEEILFKSLAEGGHHRPCNLATVHQSLRPLKNVNIENAEGLTPLLISVLKNDIPAVNLLLKCNADPNLQTGKGSPLGITLQNNHTALLELLLKHGANPNTLMAAGRPILCEAITQDYPEGVQLLLKYGADPNKPMPETDGLKKISPLFHLFHISPSRSKEILDLLLKYKADTKGVNWSPTTTDNIVTWALSSQMQQTMLPWAIEQLLTNEANPNYVVPETGTTALYQSIHQGLIEVAGILLDHGANPNTLVKTLGISPFHLAIQNKNIHLIQKMLQHQANPDQKAAIGEKKQEMTPLSHLFYSAQPTDDEAIQIVSLLMDGGANPNLCTTNQTSPAWLLCSNPTPPHLSENTKIKCLQLLGKNNNLNLNTHPEGELFPLDIALQKEEFQLAKEIIKLGGIIDGKVSHLNEPRLNAFSRLHKINIVKFLVNNGVKVNEPGENGKLPLLCAFPQSSSDLEHALACMKILINAGANIKNPAIIQAAKNSPFDEVKKLIISNCPKDSTCPRKSNVIAEAVTKIPAPKKKTHLDHPPLLSDLVHGSSSGAKKTIEKLKKASIQASNDEKHLFSQLINLIRDFYVVRSTAVKQRKQIADHKNQIIKLQLQASSWMQPSSLTGKTNASLANSCLAKARSLDQKIQQMENHMIQKREIVLSQVDELCEQLSEASREQDSRNLKRALGNNIL